MQMIFSNVLSEVVAKHDLSVAKGEECFVSR
jgi:hypothetical protein